MRFRSTKADTSNLLPPSAGQSPKTPCAHTFRSAATLTEPRVLTHRLSTDLSATVENDLRTQSQTETNAGVLQMSRKDKRLLDTFRKASYRRPSFDDAQKIHDSLMQSDPLRDWLIAQSMDVTESPIEAMLITALDMLRAYQAFHGSVPAVHTQHPAGAYRIDVMVEGQTYTGHVFRLAIEADGHEFHERTPAQAEYDRQRERWLQGNGFEVMRFTGREIHRNCFHCAQQVYDRYNAIAELGSWRAA